MKVVSIVGARPNFIKMTPFIKAIEQSCHEHILIHSGQHYDFNLSDIFFSEMKLKNPNYHLEVGSGTHAYQTGEILKLVEPILIKEEPDIVIVPGDTNTNMAGALAAIKIHQKIGHIEAGLRSYDKTIPEEVNRIIIDHCSDLLFSPTKFAVSNLQKEGIVEGVHYVGDTMYELMTSVQDKIDKINLGFDLPANFILCTIHRAVNTAPEPLLTIFKALMNLEKEILLPLHPRTKNKLEELNILEQVKEKINIIEPVGFLEFSSLIKKSVAVITDSGGVQKEAYWNKKPCITLRDTTEWINTIEENGNILVDVKDLKEKVDYMLNRKIKFKENLYGFKDTSKRILKILEEKIEK